MLSPICLFTYNRPEETRLTLEALQQNFLSPECNLFIFSDGPKNESQDISVKEVREYIHTIKGFKSIEIFESKENKGLANSIIQGVTKIIRKYGRVIVLEDDLITSPNFLDFMNQALDFYQNEEKIFSISGYTMDLPTLKSYSPDFYLGFRASSWGWATWSNQWENINWNVDDYMAFKWNIYKQIKFMRGGSDMPFMLWKQMNGKINSWAIRWGFHQFLNNKLTIYPKTSMIYNIGIGNNSTHTKTGNHFNPNNFKNNTMRHFNFDNNLLMNSKITSEFRGVFSIYNRLKNKLRIK
jgi:hypothetical protein